ncbi:MAG: SDR family NAD(P)-dependent oxidoreductase [Gemmatimonadetes bacterium]|nr:SDR family NAD(P)-dependent oxidoreductase [Gemmatimonadota bacterium]
MATIVLTGATSGIGRQAALSLSAAGHRLLVVGRNDTLLEALVRDCTARGGPAPEPFRADLSLMREVRRVAAELSAAAPAIDVLVNNAGAIFDTRRETAEGLEMTFALNHVAYWLLTRLLLGNLAAAPEGRVVSTASAAHARGHLDFADLQSTRRYTGWGVYGTSKLANILFTRELARRLSADPRTPHVTASCLHPGFVATRFGDDNGLLMSASIRAAKVATALSEEKGADTLIWLATASDPASRHGGFFEKRRPGTLTAEARDDEAARRLWDATAAITGEPA